jgi:OOP family OmpA-OmpF porin
VREYLTTQGLPANRMQVAGVGDSQPIADNVSAEGRQHNRRISFAIDPKVRRE